MRPFEQRFQQHARAPHDIAELDRSIILGWQNLLELPNGFEEELVDSWMGVAGQFEGCRVEVDPSFVSQGKCNVGYLGTLQVVQVDIENTWDINSKSKYYSGSVITAQLTRKRLWSQEETSDVVLAVPDRASRANIKKAVFTRVKF